MFLAADSDRVRILLARMPGTAPRQVVSSALELPQAPEKPNVRCLLFDPNGVAASFLHSLVSRAHDRGRECLITSARTVRSTELILHWADQGVAGALLCDCEADRAEMVRRLVSNDVECTLPMRLLAVMRSRLLMLPLVLRTVLVGVAASRCQARMSIGELARLGEGSPRSIARWLAAAGLAPPGTLLAAFRLAHLWPDLRASTVSMSALARGYGYSSDRALRSHCDRVLGVSPRRLRRCGIETELLNRLTGLLLRFSSERPWAETTT